jgi:hypothetical protein
MASNTSPLPAARVHVEDLVGPVALVALVGRAVVVPEDQVLRALVRAAVRVLLPRLAVHHRHKDNEPARLQFLQHRRLLPCCLVSTSMFSTARR